MWRMWQSLRVDHFDQLLKIRRHAPLSAANRPDPRPSADNLTIMALMLSAKNVALIDDDAGCSALLQKQLAALGADVRTFSSGAAFLEVWS